MPHYRIHMINSEFESSDEAEHPSLEAAQRSAVAAAVNVAAEAILKGQPTAAVAIEIATGDNAAARTVVALSVSDLSGGK